MIVSGRDISIKYNFFYENYTTEKCVVFNLLGTYLFIFYLQRIVSRSGQQPAIT